MAFQVQNRLPSPGKLPPLTAHRVSRTRAAALLGMAACARPPQAGLCGAPRGPSGTLRRRCWRLAARPARSTAADACGWWWMTDGRSVRSVPWRPGARLHARHALPEGERLRADGPCSGRLLHPLIRTGAKGQGAFRRASWDEAATLIADRWQALIAAQGVSASSRTLRSTMGPHPAERPGAADATGSGVAAGPDHLAPPRRTRAGSR
jgi:anaerobic selenocysteine-containing dehydrogenase